MSSTEGSKTDVAKAQGDHVKPTAGDDAKVQAAVVDDVPDPDEDDLDDLDGRQA
jgi:hypothetical protein